MNTNIFDPALQCTNLGAVYHFVVEKLTSKRTCGDTPNLNVKKISLVGVDYNSYNSMRALECVFEGLLYQTQIKKEMLHVVKTIPIHYNEYIAKGNYGVVAKVKLLKKFDIVLKTILQQFKSDCGESMNFIIEYFMGIAVINKFRRSCPNFCYTLGSFMCDNTDFFINKQICGKGDGKNQYMCYEYVEGNPLNDIKSKLTLDEMVNILLQLALSLEIAQRENRFCHYDLNGGNIIIRKKATFSILLDDMCYLFEDQYQVVIIDYNFSVMTYGGKHIYTDRCFVIDEKYGRKPYLIPGFDIYYILTSFIQLPIKQEALKIFNRLFPIDPYNGNYDDRDSYGYYQPFIHSTMAHKTPHCLLVVLKELYYNKINMIPRTLYYNFSTPSVYDYYNMYTELDTIPTCIDRPNSLLSEACIGKDVDVYNLSPLQQEYLQNDLTVFRQYETFLVPTIKDTTRILNTTLTTITKEVMEYARQYEESNKVVDDITACHNMVYMMSQTNTSELFQPYITNFLYSPAYQYYFVNRNKIRITRRWIQTLEDNIFFSR